MSENSQIFDLVQAMNRAKTSGMDDQQKAKLGLMVDFSHQLVDLADRFSRPQSDGVQLSTLEIEKVMVGVVGCIVKTACDNPVDRLMIASELAGVLVATALEKE